MGTQVTPERYQYDGWSCRIVRYTAAFLLLLYGFAKISGSQFKTLYSALDTPMGQVSGSELTWYYFGFSHFYKAFIAMGEIVPAMLLTSRRTTLLGACMLAGVLANVVVIDLCFGIALGATLVASLLLVAMIWLISLEAKTLVATFWPRSIEPANSNRIPVSARWGVRLGMLILVYGFMVWAVSYGTRTAIPLDGAWDVVHVEPDSLTARMPQTIFFEHKRANMSVFKERDGLYQSHHFEVDQNNRSVKLWAHWLTKDALIFSGSYAFTNQEMTLDGTIYDLGHCILRLHRRTAHQMSQASLIP